MFPRTYATSERSRARCARRRARLGDVTRPSSRRFGGIATVGVVGSLALVATAGLVLWGQPAPAADDDAGILRNYDSAPEIAWSIDEAALPGYAGTGDIVVADHHGEDWLLSYPSLLGGASAPGRSFLLVNGTTGVPAWPAPVRAGLGDCAVNTHHQVGCAIKLGDEPDGFYVVDEDGAARQTGPLDLTAQVTAVGTDFLRTDQSGRRVELRSPAGATRWVREFPAAAIARVTAGDLVVDTADGGAAILDPVTGADSLSCVDCRVLSYPRGVVTVVATPGKEAVSFYPRRGGNAERVANGMTVVAGASEFPVLSATGPSQVLASAGRYEIVDPGTGHGVWQIGDPELSKSNTRPCGSVVAMARKDRARQFFTLAEGSPLGKLAPPSVEDPDHNLDLLSCVGSTTSGNTAIFASPSLLTAFDVNTGAVVWDLDLNGTPSSIDGTVVLSEGSSLRVLRPR